MNGNLQQKYADDEGFLEAALVSTEKQLEETREALRHCGQGRKEAEAELQHLKEENRLLRQLYGDIKEKIREGMVRRLARKLS